MTFPCRNKRQEKAREESSLRYVGQIQPRVLDSVIPELATLVYASHYCIHALECGLDKATSINPVPT